MTYLSKDQRQCIEESLTEISSSLQNLAQRGDTFKLETMAKELFKSRPSEIPYIIPFIEYSLYQQTTSKTFNPQEFAGCVTDILYKHSDFHPTRRYSFIICMFLYFLNML